MDDIKVNWAMWVIKAFGSVCPSSFIFFCPAPESQWWCWFSDLLASLQAFDHADSLLKSISSQQVSLRQAMFPYDLHLIAQLSLHSVAASGSLSNWDLQACMLGSHSFSHCFSSFKQKSVLCVSGATQTPSFEDSAGCRCPRWNLHPEGGGLSF